MDKKKTEIEFDGDLKIMDLDADDHPTDGPANFDVPEKEQPYTGPERRRGERRKSGDRRQDIRFEKDKPDRRSGKDRRKGTWDIKYRI